MYPFNVYVNNEYCGTVLCNSLREAEDEANFSFGAYGTIRVERTTMEAVGALLEAEARTWH